MFHLQGSLVSKHTSWDGVIHSLDTETHKEGVETYRRGDMEKAQEWNKGTHKMEGAETDFCLGRHRQQTKICLNRGDAYLLKSVTYKFMSCLQGIEYLEMCF